MLLSLKDSSIWLLPYFCILTTWRKLFVFATVFMWYISSRIFCVWEHQYMDCKWVIMIYNRLINSIYKYWYKIHRSHILIFGISIYNNNIYQHSYAYNNGIIKLNTAHCHSWPHKEKTEIHATVVPCLQHWYEDWHTIVLLPKWPPYNFLWIWITSLSVVTKCKITSYVWSSSEYVFAWPYYLLPFTACLNNLLHDYVVIHKYLINHRLMDENGCVFFVFDT